MQKTVADREKQNSAAGVRLSTTDVQCDKSAPEAQASQANLKPIHSTSLAKGVMQAEHLDQQSNSRLD